MDLELQRGEVPPHEQLQAGWEALVQRTKVERVQARQSRILGGDPPGGPNSCSGLVAGW